jgi:hypothetical protein
MELYDIVIKNMNGKEELLTGENCSKISMLTETYAEDIYLLILHYYVSEKQNKEKLLANELPYSSKTVSKDGKGIVFKLALLPEELQKIIFRYLTLISN